MDPDAYEASAAEFFARLTKAIDQLDPDLVEADGTSDMVTITALQSGEKVVVNTQRAVKQVWVAGKGEGIHFTLGPDGRWVDDKGRGLELSTWVAQCIDAACGVSMGVALLD